MVGSHSCPGPAWDMSGQVSCKGAYHIRGSVKELCQYLSLGEEEAGSMPYCLFLMSFPICPPIRVLSGPHILSFTQLTGKLTSQSVSSTSLLLM